MMPRNTRRLDDDHPERTLRIIAVVNQKGGSGKTTVTVNLATYAAARGDTVSVIDLDPQTSASKWSEVRLETTGLTNPATCDIPHIGLFQMLEAVRQQGCDLALIDTPPQLNSIAMHAVDAADLVILPTRLSKVDASALDTTLQQIGKAGHLTKCSILINALSDVSRAALADVERVASGHAVAIIGARLPDNARFVASFNDGRGVSELDPKGVAARSIAMVYQHAMDQLSVSPSGTRRRRK